MHSLAVAVHGGSLRHLLRLKGLGWGLRRGLGLVQGHLGWRPQGLGQLVPVLQG